MRPMRFSVCPLVGDPNHWRIHGEVAPDALLEGIGEGTKDLGGAPALGRGRRDGPGRRLRRHLRGATQGLGEDGSIIVFVHGFQFDPRFPQLKRAARHKLHDVNRHAGVLGFRQKGGAPGDAAEIDGHATPWLARMTPDGISRDFPGLAVTFAYESCGGALVVDGQVTDRDVFDMFADFNWRDGRLSNAYSRAYQEAGRAGRALADVIEALAEDLARSDPQGGDGRGRKIDIVCHSLGSRVALKAVEVLADRYRPAGEGANIALNRVGRVVMMAGAALWPQAASALEAVIAAEPDWRPELYNVGSVHDDVLRILGSRMALSVSAAEAGLAFYPLENLIRFITGAETIGIEGAPKPWMYGGDEEPYADWIDLPLSSAGVRDWGRRQGFELKGDHDPDVIGDHWVHCTWPGNWALYRAILRDAARARWSVNRLRRDLAVKIPPARLRQLRWEARERDASAWQGAGV